jgi:hypothetical protein
MIRGGDIMIVSPATRTSIPLFWHSAPNIDPTAEFVKITSFSKLQQGIHRLERVIFKLK